MVLGVGSVLSVWRVLCVPPFLLINPLIVHVISVGLLQHNTCFCMDFLTSIMHASYSMTHAVHEFLVLSLNQIYLPFECSNDYKQR